MEDYSHLRANHKGEEESQSLLGGETKGSPDEAKHLLQKLKQFSGYIEDVIFYNLIISIGSNHFLEIGI